MSEPFIGEIRLWPLTYAPRDWAYCDGQLAPIAQNPALFAVISNLYGGDGMSTMAMPNLQARAVVGSGRGPGLTQRYLTERIGYPVMDLLEGQLPSHNHIAYGVKGFGAQGSGANQYHAARYDEETGNVLKSYKQMTEAGDTASSETLAKTGKGDDHENMQPYLTLNYCIALEGIFPSHS